MSFRAAIRPRIEWFAQQVDRLRIGANLTWSGFAALVAALLALVSCGVVLIAVSQDVLFGDGLAPRDPANLQLFTDHRSDLIDSAARVATQAGSVAVLVPLGLIAGALLWWKGAKVAVALAPLASLLMAGGLAGVAKVLVGRSRPPAVLHLVNETDASFPSGHATDSAALFLAVALVLAVFVLQRPLARALTVAAALALEATVAASRLVLGVHWPTDVIVGLALGTIVALVVTTGAVLATHADGARSLDASRRRRVLTTSVALLNVRRRPGRVLATGH